MAEAKKEEKKEGWKPDSLEAVLGEIVGVVIIVIIISRLISNFRNPVSSGGVASFWARTGIPELFTNFKFAFIVFSNILAILFFIGIVYSLFRLRQLEDEWQTRLYPQPEEGGADAPVKNEKWQRVVEHINSENPSDWRLAILEADIMLDEVLDQEGYIGNTIGDKLKSANKGDFRTLDIAWEAHRIRNAIAHEGQDFVLTKREAYRIIGLYEAVFTEFKYI